MSERYEAAWEGFWTGLSPTQGAAVWDSDPSVAAALHAPFFEPYFDPGLPVVDLGCGNGTQTRHLATRFARVIGVDMSRAALHHAHAATTDETATFRHMNLLDAAAVDRLHEELGDVNAYMRGLIHQMEPTDRPVVATALARLLGDRGHVFAVELAAAARPMLKALTTRPEGPPPKLARVFQFGLTPAEWQDGELEATVTAAGLKILTTGDIPLYTTEEMPDGSRLDLPMRYLVARPSP